jgi:hypothetical protein
MGETTEHAGATDSYACARDYQLFGPGPKRVLALDGGGVRGAITVAFLERIEALLSQSGSATTSTSSAAPRRARSSPARSRWAFAPSR